MLEGDDFADKATRDVFALLWKIIALLVEKAFFLPAWHNGICSYISSSDDQWTLLKHICSRTR